MTNETIALAIAPYLGQMVLTPEGECILSGIYYTSTPVFFDVFIDYEWKDIKLLLTPLSKMTDEDAIAVARMRFGFHGEETPQVFLNGFGDKVVVLNGTTGPRMVAGMDYLSISQFQFLQSKGYDLPSYHLAGKTLIESGIAIDKTLQ